MASHQRESPDQVGLDSLSAYQRSQKPPIQVTEDLYFCKQLLWLVIAGLVVMGALVFVFVLGWWGG